MVLRNVSPVDPRRILTRPLLTGESVAIAPHTFVMAARSSAVYRLRYRSPLVVRLRDLSSSDGRLSSFRFDTRPIRTWPHFSSSIFR